MMGPAFFEPIRQKASDRWDQLEADPELAGPWHQLFKQVQSPRHVLSELLQNADDAEATEANVTLTEQEFIFSHNGEDFKEEHFASLCRFGYSNKRALHTIGFRGIGFKSTFSLGDTVYLSTPTLQVAYDRQRFTEPVFLQQARLPEDAKTYVVVPISDEHRRKDLLKNLEEWKSSPVSLLFFRHLRSLTILDHRIHWKTIGQGPVPNSEWMTAEDGDSGEKHLRIWSEEEMFPVEAVEEIQQERLLPSGEAMSLPPCKVEIVLGFKGRLYVVLPTGVHTGLPFACNAPFVQDPARVKIKDPEISPTNRWLLDRIGRLAAKTMLVWVNSPNHPADYCMAAYQLLPNLDREDTTLDGSCGTLVELAFEEAIKDEVFVLTLERKLVGWSEAVHLPSILYDVWPAKLVTSTFAPDTNAILTPELSSECLSAFEDWGFIESIEVDQAISTLCHSSLPRPKSWSRLLLLWDLIAEFLREHPHHFGYRSNLVVRIVPVQGQESLYSPQEVVRLGEKQILQSDDDWTFLTDYLLAMNANWTRYLAEQRRETADSDSEEHARRVENSYWLLEKAKLAGTSDIATIVTNVTDQFFSGQELSIADCVRLTRIFAKLNAPVPDSFQYVTQDDALTHVSYGLLIDLDQTLDSVLSEEIYKDCVVHDSYLRPGDDSCSRDEWATWLGSSRSKLLTFPSLDQAQQQIYGDSKARAFVSRYCNDSEISRRFKGSHYRFIGWDFEETLWQFWQEQAEGDENFWPSLMERLLAQRSAFWGGDGYESKLYGRLYQISQQNTTHLANSHRFIAPWIEKFRRFSCFRDTRGLAYKPEEIFCRTSETEPLIGSEPFIPHSLDTEENRPLLLALGVRSKPSGPERILDQLRAHILANPRDMEELDRLYRSLDRLSESGSTETLHIISSRLTERPLILCEGDRPEKLQAVFIHADENDAPGVAVIHPAIKYLGLWRRLGIPERPTVDLAIEWLRSLSSGARIPAEQQNRVKALIAKYPERIWRECDHWLNMQGEWVSIESLAYSISMQSLVPTKHLFPQIRGQIADFTKLPAELVAGEPFSALPPVSGAIKDQIDPSSVVRKTATAQPWIYTVGEYLSRIKLPQENETERIRQLGSRLMRTSCSVVPSLQAIPYLDDAPAGPPRNIAATWIDSEILVANASRASMAKAVTDTIAVVMADNDIRTAVQLCYERPCEFIHDYMSETFELAEPLVPDSQPDNAATVEGQGEPIASDLHPSTRASRQEEDANEETHKILNQEAFPSDKARESPLEEEFSSEDDESMHDEESRDAIDSDAEEGEEAPIPRRRHAPAKPPLIERYAVAKGFRQNGSGEFRHSDGRVIQRSQGGMFPWELYSASGDRLRGIYPKEHCLLSEPLEFPSEFWLYCEKYPESLLILLVDGEGEPFELHGEVFQTLASIEALSLHPAAYRIRCEDADLVLQECRRERLPDKADHQ